MTDTKLTSAPTARHLIHTAHMAMNSYKDSADYSESNPDSAKRLLAGGDALMSHVNKFLEANAPDTDGYEDLELKASVAMKYREAAVRYQRQIKSAKKGI